MAIALDLDPCRPPLVGRPFLVVTPLGLTTAIQLAATLAALGARVVERRTVQPWSHAATALYARPERAGAGARARRFEERWRALFPSDRAECWLLAGDDDYAVLRAHKAALRGHHPGIPLSAHGADACLFSLHAFHVPDPRDVRPEGERLATFLT